MLAVGREAGAGGCRSSERTTRYQSARGCAVTAHESDHRLAPAWRSGCDASGASVRGSTSDRRARRRLPDASAIVHGRIAGTWGDVGVLSFGGSKLLTAGRGGALVTRDAEIVQRIRVQTQRGNDAYPLSELQAAVLVPQLDRLAERNQLRAENVSRLLGLLSDVTGLRCFVEAAGSGKSRRAQPDDSQPGYFKLGFWFEAASFGCSRDDFACAMRAAGVAFDLGFRALHRTHARGRFRAVNGLPHATRADRRSGAASSRAAGDGRGFAGNSRGDQRRRVAPRLGLSHAVTRSRFTARSISGRTRRRRRRGRSRDCVGRS